MMSVLAARRRFSDLSEAEVLALAISSEEDDARIYAMYAERLRAEFPASAAVFDGMAVGGERASPAADRGLSAPVRRR